MYIIHCRNTIDVLEALQPLFVVDFYLPRTFMACLRVEESAEVLKTGKIPFDVCCASLNFLLKYSSPQYQFTFSITNDEQVCNFKEIDDAAAGYKIPFACLLWPVNFPFWQVKYLQSQPLLESAFSDV